MESMEQTYSLPSERRVRIDQGRGAIRVVGGETQEVRLRASAASREALDRLRVTETAGGLEIAVQGRRRGIFGLFVHGLEEFVDLDLLVPRGTALELDTGSGPVEVAGTQGTVDLDAGSGSVLLTGVLDTEVDGGSGDIELFRVEGDLTVDAGSGRVKAQQVRGEVRIDVGSGGVLVQQVLGPVEVDAGSGNVQIDAVEGEVSVDTGSGDVSIRAVRGASIKAETGSGRVELLRADAQEIAVETGSGSIDAELIAVDPRGTYQFEADSGRITIALPADAQVSFEMEVEGGRISFNGLPLQIRQQEDESMSATLNGGGAEMSITTGSGIHLRAHSGQPPQMAGGSEPGLAKLMSDPALQNSQHVQRILQMVAEGKLTPDQADEILRALDEEEEPS